MIVKRKREDDDLSSDENLVEDTCPFCRLYPESSKQHWIQCDKCDVWYHCTCVNLSDSLSAQIVSYHCKNCEPEFGPSTFTRTSSREKISIDYAALNSGDTIGALNASAARQKTHRHWNSLEFGTFSSGIFPVWTHDKPLTNLLSSGNTLIQPVIIPKSHYETLDMRIPPDLTVSKVTEYVGHDYPLPVMDVSTQLNATGWTMGSFQDYFTSNPTERTEIYNVISLEISNTPLGKSILRPAVVRNLDLLDKVWPSSDSSLPKVSLYCLMSVKNSFTDFHIDFGASSVFYHVCHGKKTFLFIEPSRINLAKYEKWCLAEDQNSVFFADLVSQTHRVDLNQGDTMIIPSGWIHAVYTPEDTLVIGGNFLTSVNIITQIELAKIERRTKVPQKFRFPYFSKVLYYTALYYMTHIPTSVELQGLSSLHQYLCEELQPLSSYLISGAKGTKHIKRHYEGKSDRVIKLNRSEQAILKSIPKNLRKDVLSFLDRFQQRLQQLKSASHHLIK